jgi:serine/threonine-protein kinase ATR
LHLVTDFESAHQLVEIVRQTDFTVNERPSRELIKNFLEHWNARLELIQPSASVIEPVIGLRRIILGETKKLILSSLEQRQQSGRTINEMIDEEISKLWMKSTEYATKANMFQRAHLYILNAEQYKPKELFLEKAKLLWNKGDQPNAFKMLENGIAPMLDLARDGDLRKLPKSMRKIYAEAKLWIAEWNAEKVNIDTELNLKYYKESISVFSESEKSLVQLASYLDRLYTSMPNEKEQNARGGAMLVEIVTFYGKSMEYGCNFIYQSMPRILSIWFDYTSLLPADRTDENYAQNAENITKCLERFINTLPTFLFFTAFSQLVSRICHPSQEVYNALKTILIKLITYFPQQCLWLIMSVFKSSYTNRVKRCTELFFDKRLSDPAMQVLIRDFNSLAERFIELTNKEITKEEAKPTVSGLVKGLPQLINSKKFSEIVMPVEKYMQLVMPPFSERDKSASNVDPFPNHLVHIVGVREEVVVLMSLQRPRRITLIGSDGKDYVVMLKPKDDLRKDYRLMEFNAVVKEYLHQDPEARHRRLNIRTYQVKINLFAFYVNISKTIHIFSMHLLMEACFDLQRHRKSRLFAVWMKITSFLCLSFIVIFSHFLLNSKISVLSTIHFFLLHRLYH